MGTGVYIKQGFEVSRVQDLTAVHVYTPEFYSVEPQPWTSCHGCLVNWAIHFSHVGQLRNLSNRKQAALETFSSHPEKARTDCSLWLQGENTKPDTVLLKRAGVSWLPLWLDLHLMQTDYSCMKIWIHVFNLGYSNLICIWCIFVPFLCPNIPVNVAHGTSALIQGVKEIQRSVSRFARKQHIFPSLHTSDSSALLLSFPSGPCLSQSLCISAER